MILKYEWEKYKSHTSNEPCDAKTKILSGVLPRYYNRILNVTQSSTWCYREVGLISREFPWTMYKIYTEHKIYQLKPLDTSNASET